MNDTQFLQGRSHETHYMRKKTSPLKRRVDKQRYNNISLNYQNNQLQNQSKFWQSNGGFSVRSRGLTEHNAYTVNALPAIRRMQTTKPNYPTAHSSIVLINQTTPIKLMSYKERHLVCSIGQKPTWELPINGKPSGNTMTKERFSEQVQYNEKVTIRRISNLSKKNREVTILTQYWHLSQFNLWWIFKNISRHINIQTLRKMIIKTHILSITTQSSQYIMNGKRSMLARTRQEKSKI